ncbi:hypothetical protein BS78_04G221500 [Paspalum vaginatum]|nr:hypothetical protein BS78_04G221500 [Paspalum vaginatum]
MSFSLIRSPQALKRPQLKNSTSITALLVVSFILTLYVTTCEARHLRVHGKHCSSNKLPSSPPKVVVDVGAANGKMMGSSLKDPVGSDGMDASSTCNEAAIVAKKKEVASSGGVVTSAKHVVRVLQQLHRRGHEGDQGIHLDYAQPRTHTPHHNL